MKIGLNDSSDIRLSALPLTRVGKDNFNEFLSTSADMKRWWLNLIWWYWKCIG